MKFKIIYLSIYLIVFLLKLQCSEFNLLKDYYNALEYRNKGKYENAIKLFENVLHEQKKNSGPESPEVAVILTDMGTTYGLIGKFNKAEECFEKCINIWENIVGETHPNIALSLINRSAVFTMKNEHLKAINDSEKALSIFKKEFGLQNKHTADCLKNMAVIHMGLGNYKKAIELDESSVSIHKSIYGQMHGKTGLAINNLATDYKLNNEYEKALSLYEEALTIYKKNEPAFKQQYAQTLDNIADVYLQLKNEDLAINFYNDSLKLNELIFGNNHYTCSQNFKGLGSAYLSKGDVENAIACFNKSLDILYDNFGESCPQALSAYKMLAISYYCRGDIDSAIKSFNKNYNAINNESNIVFSLDEKSRLAWQNANLDFWFATFLDAKRIAQVSLQRKGVVLETILEDRALIFAANLSADGTEVIQEINYLQNKLSRIIFQENNNEHVNDLNDKISRLQRELTTKYLGRDRQRISSSITMADIIPALSGGGVLVDFIQFDDPKLKGEEATCLGAIITAEDNNPVLVRIDSGAAINRAIDSLRAAINQGNAAEVEAQTKFLSEKLWQPVAAKIPEGVKRLFICPDASLNFLSFAALLESDGRFVAEKYPISYIGSARDLAKKPSEKITKSMAIFANPQFDASGKNSKTTEMVAMRSAEADVFGSIALPPLPGTETEAQSLGSLATESGWQTKSYLGKDATESIVRNTKKPGVLHLATHGFYLNSFTPPGPEGSRGMSVVGVKETTDEKKKKEKGVDPMRASGVALTGAQQTLTSWSQKKAPNPETDGVLTAEEVGALRLDGTWMVVLSACETGVGEARSGEGVFGLRRAFMIAGAENLLMTLWPVADETTAKIMTDFYKEAFATGDAPGSLAKVQRDWLVKIRQERGLLAAIREAGPFAMVTMTNPNAQREFVEGQLEVAPEKAAIPKSDKILEFQVALAKANAGDSYAQAVVSIYYGLGVGCDQDPAKSKDYVMLSAKQQNPLGIYRLAEMRESGEGMEQNAEQAAQLMKKAKPGLQKLSSDPYALTALATIYERENPASPNVRELLTKASDMGYEPAQTKLSQIQTNQ